MSQHEGQNPKFVKYIKSLTLLESCHYQEEEWCEASLEVMVSMISSEYLRVDSEYQVY